MVENQINNDELCSLLKKCDISNDEIKTENTKNTKNTKNINNKTKIESKHPKKIIIKRKTNLQKFEELFKPDSDGVSKSISTKEIITSGLPWTKNGNCRKGNPPWDLSGKYKWHFKRKNDKSRGEILFVKSTGFNKDKELSHPININIRNKFNAEQFCCLNCGIKKDLVIDHKNDLYNNKKILDKSTQTFEDFQRLCDKCNNDLKHSIHEKERQTGKLHKAKDVGKFLRDNFEYPWEKGLTEYKEKDEKGNNIWIQDEIHCCKFYTYWYDIEAFENRREWYLLIRKVNLQIKNLKTKKDKIKK